MLFNYRIIQFNYPNNIDNLTWLVLDYLKQNNITIKNSELDIYWQSMWWKVAILVASFLNNKWYKVNNLYINSSPILSQDVIYWIYPKIQTLMYNVAWYIKSKYLYWIISPKLTDNWLNINKDEIIKIIKSQQKTFKNYTSIYSKLKFLKNNDLIIKSIKWLNVSNQIVLIKSIPPSYEYKDFKKNDWLIKHSFSDSFLKYYKKQNYKIINVKNTYHSQVAERNLYYYKEIKNISFK